MKAILSFLKPVSKGLDWVRQGLVTFWRVTRVGVFPTEKNLVLSFWYDYAHFKARRAGVTVYDFWDDRVVYIKQVLEDPDSSSKKKQLYRDLLNALHQPRLLEIFINFLESSPPEEHYLPVVKAMRRAWRHDGQQVIAPGETQEPKGSEERHEPSEQRDVPEFHAKTYYIAAELYYELAGRQDEFQVVCRQMTELKAFVQRQFKVARLPGTFDKKLKGYSYKGVLTGRDAAKKGQLKPCFRQIADNPQVFGEAIAERAQQILTEHFH